ncbi:MAG: FadR/GntR family transcriptional regulator [Desulfocucumaceae bacterium]
MIDNVIVKILSYIEEKRLSAGDRLPPERALAAELGFNRTSLREALAVMEYMRYIQRRQGSGVFLLNINHGSFEGNIYRLLKEDDITPEEAYEIYEAVILVESVIGQLAAGRKTDGDIKALRDNIEGMERLLAAGENTYKLDVDFHRIIATMAKNTFLLQISISFWMRLSGYAQLIQSHPEQAGDLIGHHRRIVSAIEEGNITEADRLIKMHYRYSLDFTGKYLVKPAPGN